MDPATGAVLGGMGVSALGSIFGANAADNANRRQVDSQNAWRQSLMNQIRPLMTPAGQQNPYELALQNFFGANHQSTTALPGTEAQSISSQSNAFMRPGGNPGTAQIAEMSYAQAPRVPMPWQPGDEAPAPPGQPGPTAPTGPGPSTQPYVPPVIEDPGTPASPAQAIPNFGQMQQYTPYTPGQMTSTNVQAGWVNTPQVEFDPSGSQAFNAGQDGLLQSMRRQFGASQDAGLNSPLMRMVNGESQFDNSSLFSSLGAQDARAMNEQVAALRGSAGSLGARFGSALNRNEADLRGRLTEAASTRNAQIGMQSFEAAQARAMQGLGLGVNREQFAATNALNQANLQQQAAQALGQMGTQQLGMNLNAAQSNAANALAAGQSNAGNYLQADLANQHAGMQTQQFNINNAIQQAQFGAQQGNIANNLAMQGLSMGSQMGQMPLQNNIQLLSLLAGLPAQAVQGPSAMPGAIAQAGQMGMLLPFMFREMNAGRPQPTQPWSPFPWGN